MFMRYLWGLGVGHTYAHRKMCSGQDGDSELEGDDDQAVYNGDEGDESESDSDRIRYGEDSASESDS
jgi:hypothetical protein